MKVRSERGKTKVVIRHLPPSLTESDLIQHIHNRFASRYRWFVFRPGNTRYFFVSHKTLKIPFAHFSCESYMCEIHSLMYAVTGIRGILERI